jgi:lysylphosphatidylglycerol synthetase-like protein (DUF2156 family)
MSRPGPMPAQPAEHRRRRLRQMWLLLALGVVLAVVAAGVAGLVGLPGEVAAVGFLLVASLACAVTGVVALVTSMVDDLKDRGVGRLPLLGGVLLLIAFLLIGMVMSIAGS